jgi:hypothetical protein
MRMAERAVGRLLASELCVMRRRISKTRGWKGDIGLLDELILLPALVVIVLYAGGRTGGVLDRAEGDDLAKITLGLVAEERERDETITFTATGEFLRDVALAGDDEQDAQALAGQDVGERFEHVFILGGGFAVLGVAILPRTKFVEGENQAVVAAEFDELLVDVGKAFLVFGLELARDETGIDDGLAEFFLAVLGPVVGHGLFVGGD